MRSFRLWTNRTSVAVQWRVKGFKVRTMTFLWFVSSLALAAAGTRIALAVTVALLLVAVIPPTVFTVYVYRNDPHLRIREITMLRNMWRGSKRPTWTNDVAR